MAEDRISAIEPNKLLLMFSKALRAGREGLNYPGKLPDSVPLLGGMGLGDLMVGKSPEAFEDYSYGFGPFHRGKGLTTVVDPRLVDIAGLPVPYVGAAKVTKLGAQKLMAKALKEGAETPVDMSRREFSKKLAGVTGAVAVPGAALKIGSELAADVAPRAAVSAAKNAIFGPVAAGMKNVHKWVDEGGFGRFMGDQEWADMTEAALKRAAIELERNPEFNAAAREAAAKWGDDVVADTMTYRATTQTPSDAMNYRYGSDVPDEFSYENAWNLTDAERKAAHDWVKANPDKYDEILLHGDPDDLLDYMNMEKGFESAPKGVSDVHFNDIPVENLGPVARMTKMMFDASSKKFDEYRGIERFIEELAGSMVPATPGEHAVAALVKKHGGDPYKATMDIAAVDDLLKRFPELSKDIDYRARPEYKEEFRRIDEELTRDPMLPIIKDGPPSQADWVRREFPEVK